VHKTRQSKGKTRGWLRELFCIDCLCLSLSLSFTQRKKKKKKRRRRRKGEEEMRSKGKMIKAKLKSIAKIEGDGSAKDLEDEEFNTETTLRLWTKDAEPKIEDGHVHDVDFGNKTGFKKTCLLVETWETMAGTGDDAKELRKRVDKVDELRDKEDHESLTKVTQNTGNGKRYASKIGKSVTNKDFRRIAVKVEESEGTGKEGKEKKDTEDMLIVFVFRSPFELEEVVDQHADGNHDGLSRFKTVDAGKDIDAVCAKDDHTRHVELIKDPQIKRTRNTQRFNAEKTWNDDCCTSCVGHQQWECREEREEDLDGPSQVQHIICKAQKQHHRH